MELANRDQLEREFKAELAELTQRQKAELRRLLGNPPSVDNVPESWWRTVEKQREEVLAVSLMGIAAANSTRHGGSLSSLEAMDRWAVGRAGAVSQAWGQKTRERLSQEIESGAGRNAVSDSTFDPKRDEALGTTEVTAASVFGGEIGAGESGIRSPDDLWELHPEESASGPCQICMPLGGEPRSVWEKVFPTGPPVHPNCKCRIRYMRRPRQPVPTGPDKPIRQRRTSRRDMGDISTLAADSGYLAARRGTDRRLAASLGVSVSNLAALQALNGAGLVSGNRARRKQIADELIAAQDRTVGRVAAVLPVEKRATLYSGFGDRDDEWVSAKVGDVVTDRGYVAASTRTRLLSQGRHELTIEGHVMGKSVKGAGASVPGDVLFSPGSRFLVTSRTVDPTGNISLRVTEVP